MSLKIYVPAGLVIGWRSVGVWRVRIEVSRINCTR